MEQELDVLQAINPCLQVPKRKERYERDNKAVEMGSKPITS